MTETFVLEYGTVYTESTVICDLGDSIYSYNIVTGKQRAPQPPPLLLLLLLLLLINVLYIFGSLSLPVNSSIVAYIVKVIIFSFGNKLPVFKGSFFPFFPSHFPVSLVLLFLSTLLGMFNCH